MIISKFSGFIIAMIRKIILGVIIFIFLSLLGLILFFPLDTFVKKKINESIGPAVTFSNLSIGWDSIVADSVIIKTSSGTDFLRIKQLKLRPSLWGLLKKKLEIKEVEFESPELAIRKAKNGRWLLPEFTKKDKGRSSFEFIIKAFKVNDGSIFFADDLKGFNLKLTDFTMDMKSRMLFLKPGKTSINASARLPSEGKVSIAAEGEIFNKNFKGALSIKNLDMTLLRPYMKDDVRLNKGRMYIDSNFLVDKGYVRAPSTLRIRDIDIETRGIFMGVSAPLVIELVKKKGEIVLIFNVWGRWDDLQNDIKKSFKRKVFEEAGRTLTSPVEDVVKSIEGFLPVRR